MSKSKTNTLNPITRRGFLRLSSAALAALAACKPSSPTAAGRDFEVEINNSFLRGHRMFDPNQTPPEVQPVRRTEVLVVGGGIAGLAAAYELKGRETVVCELADTLGGSSGHGSYNDIRFAQGAHYDLEYPAYYGREVLHLLHELGVIHFNPVRNVWEFREQRYLIDLSRESRCQRNGVYQDDPLPDTPQSDRFKRMVINYTGDMPMPTRLIHEKYHYLNQINFADFLTEQGFTGEAFFQGIDYQMKDDYGAGASSISALAGIHYYACRPYFTDLVQLFSPPAGNAYFVEKLAAAMAPEQLLTGHLVKSIEPNDRGFAVEVLDIKNNALIPFQVKQVVYAGHKHGLKYVYPKEAELFADNLYAPWVVMNLILETSPFKQSWWQNEIIGEDPTFLGFVNSMTQMGSGDSGYEVLTAYHCLPTGARKSLMAEPETLRQWARQTVSLIEKALGWDISGMLRKIVVTPLGHAMPIAKPGYLFKDANDRRSHENLVFAGVDNGRLPLLFEALDSGLTAARRLQHKELNH